MEDLFNSVSTAVVFSKIDLCGAYWQVGMHPKDQSKTAFRTLGGHYEFVRMPFGLRNAPATFQRLIEHVLRPFLFKTAVALIDDILIYSKTIDDHINQDLPNIFHQLRSFNLRAKIQKCEFVTNEVKFLGHVIGNKTIQPMFSIKSKRSSKCQNQTAVTMFDRS